MCSSNPQMELIGLTDAMRQNINTRPNLKLLKRFLQFMKVILEQYQFIFFMLIVYFNRISSCRSRIGGVSIFFNIVDRSIIAVYYCMYIIMSNGHSNRRWKCLGLSRFHANDRGASGSLREYDQKFAQAIEEATVT
jgi:hypothetical protein